MARPFLILLSLLAWPLPAPAQTGTSGAAQPDCGGPATPANRKRIPTKGNKTLGDYGLIVPEAGYGRDGSRDTPCSGTAIQEGSTMAGVDPGKTGGVLAPAEAVARPVQSNMEVGLPAMADGSGGPGKTSFSPFASQGGTDQAGLAPGRGRSFWPSRSASPSNRGGTRSGIAASAGPGAASPSPSLGGQGPAGADGARTWSSRTGSDPAGGDEPSGGGAFSSKAASPRSGIRSVVFRPAPSSGLSGIAQPRPGVSPTGSSSGGLWGWLRGKSHRSQGTGTVAPPDDIGDAERSWGNLAKVALLILAGLALLGLLFYALSSTRKESAEEKFKRKMSAAVVASKKEKEAETKAGAPAWQGASILSSLRQNRKKGSLAFILMALKKHEAVPSLLALVAAFGIMAAVLPAGYQAQAVSGEFAKLMGSSAFSPLLRGGGKSALASPMDSLDSRRLTTPDWSSLGFSAETSGAFLSNDPAAAGARKKKSARGSFSLDMAAAATGPMGGTSINGILRPEEARKLGNSIAMSDGELQSALDRSAGDGKDGAGRGGGGPPGGGAGVRYGGRALNKELGLLTAFKDTSAIPGAGPGAAQNAGPGRGGRYSWRNSGTPDTQPGYTLGRAVASDPIHPMTQLLETRAYSLAAAPSPPGHCDTGTCAHEVASNTSGVSFDGKHQPSGTVLASAEFGDPAVGTDPTQAPLAALADQAKQLEDDNKKCADAETNYGKPERQEMYKLMVLSEKYYKQGCSSLIGAFVYMGPCTLLRSQITDQCNVVNGISQMKNSGCPFSGRASIHDCNNLQSFGTQDPIWQNWDH